MADQHILTITIEYNEPVMVVEASEMEAPQMWRLTIKKVCEGMPFTSAIVKAGIRA